MAVTGLLSGQMDKLQANLDNKKVVDSISDELKNHRLAGRPDIRMIIEKVQVKYCRFTA